MVKHSDLFEANPRQAMVYRNWRKQPIEQQQATLAKAQYYLDNLEKL